MEDIKDNEIRIICKKTDAPVSSNELVVMPQANTKLKKWWQKKVLWVSAIIILLLAIIFLTYTFGRQAGEAKVTEEVIEAKVAEYEPETESEFIYETPTDSIFPAKPEQASFVETRDTTITDIPLRIYKAVNARPSLFIGRIDTHDKDIVLAFQAADIRKDNGKIVGACVNNGNIMSRGLSKKGYVSILDGIVTVGVADNSPLFEKAVETGGDFFRQYPLLDDGRIVENVLKGKSVRRAICERGDEILVIETLTAESMHDFSQALQDFQVKNAVYLVGSQYACGFMRDKDGERTEWGEFRLIRKKYISYIVWKKMQP